MSDLCRNMAGNRTQAGTIQRTDRRHLLPATPELQEGEDGSRGQTQSLWPGRDAGTERSGGTPAPQPGVPLTLGFSASPFTGSIIL